ncbi:hypothetical protein [Fonticella tunisiensis]|uniref:Uncharacterized protein n=1 Tax=Fonticella tunisiensis TaxID=1096341 RepID=A0A4R7KQX2_9CLOT|nr:hypothetical protein [Fonticella tunisiensis]TDT61631.1 hypothetical protein EDD71_106115 [Fonticella tunisiensis]
MPKKRRSSRNIYSFIMILLGIILIIFWMPLWIWLVILGIVLIIFGINLYYR